MTPDPVNSPPSGPLRRHPAPSPPPPSTLPPPGGFQQWGAPDPPPSGTEEFTVEEGPAAPGAPPPAAPPDPQPAPPPAPDLVAPEPMVPDPDLVTPDPVNPPPSRPLPAQPAPSSPPPSTLPPPGGFQQVGAPDLPGCAARFMKRGRRAPPRPAHRPPRRLRIHSPHRLRARTWWRRSRRCADPAPAVPPPTGRSHPPVECEPPRAVSPHANPPRAPAKPPAKPPARVDPPSAPPQPSPKITQCTPPQHVSDEARRAGRSDEEIRGESNNARASHARPDARTWPGDHNNEPPGIGAKTDRELHDQARGQGPHPAARLRRGPGAGPVQRKKVRA